MICIKINRKEYIIFLFLFVNYSVFFGIIAIFVNLICISCIFFSPTFFARINKSMGTIKVPFISFNTQNFWLVFSCVALRYFNSTPFIIGVACMFYGRILSIDFSYFFMGVVMEKNKQWTPSITLRSRFTFDPLRV